MRNRHKHLVKQEAATGSDAAVVWLFRLALRQTSAVRQHYEYVQLLMLCGGRSVETDGDRTSEQHHIIAASISEEAIVTINQITRGRMAVAAGTGRRQWVAGLVAGIAAPLLGRGEVSEAKKKRKKCKKPNTCPQRHCCSCQSTPGAPVSCHYLDVDEDYVLACEALCSSLGLPHVRALPANAGRANYCDFDLECVRLSCPVA